MFAPPDTTQDKIFSFSQGFCLTKIYQLAVKFYYRNLGGIFKSRTLTLSLSTLKLTIYEGISYWH